MGHENKVVRSLEDPGGLLCADIFRRPDGSFGYRLCRRDPEDGRGWAVIGGAGDAVCDSLETAIDLACAEVPWLSFSV